MKQPKADSTIVIEELRKEGKIKISPISREANSFDCPKCGNLLSPENPASYLDLGYEEQTGVLIQCKRCKTRIRLLWQTASSGLICQQFKKPKC
jgi:RNase P subunit RPR2